MKPGMHVAVLRFERRSKRLVAIPICQSGDCSCLSYLRPKMALNAALSNQA